MAKNTNGIIRQVIAPGLRKFLFTLFGAISLIILLNEAVGLGLVPILSLLIAEYDQLIGFAFDLVKPYIECLFTWIGWPISLLPHWKHIFALLGLYFFAGARIDYLVRGRKSSITRFLLGFLLALVTSIAVGVIPISQTNLTSHFLIATIPAAATFINDVVLRANRVIFGYSRRQFQFNRPLPSRVTYFLEGFGGITWRTVVCLLIVLGGLLLPAVQQLTSPGIALLAIVMLVHALNLILVGIKEIKVLRREEDTRRDAFLRSPGALIGLQMFALFFEVTLFLAINSGLRLLGL